MRAFEYTSPTSTKQAVSLLGAWENAEVLAGGTDLLALMKDDVVHPKRLVNIKDIKELSGITASTPGLRIGALTTLGDLADNVNVVKDYPALAEAVNEAASLPGERTGFMRFSETMVWRNSSAHRRLLRCSLRMGQGLRWLERKASASCRWRNFSSFRKARVSASTI